MHLFGDDVALVLGNVADSDSGYAAVTAVGADPDAGMSARSEWCHEDVETSCCVTDEGRPFGAAL